MTLFDLVIRSMRKNIKHYYLYFFALIFSVVLYFVFATLQHDPSIVEQSGGKMGSGFKAAGILLLFISGIFVVYANSIFLKRRSREIGLYQLIGLTKSSVSRLLVIENTLLSAGALAIGIGIGILVSRVFLLLLMKLVGFDGFIELSFSKAAVVQTISVFLVIIVLTSAQMLFSVYRSTLLGLFNADKAGENPKKPKAVLSAILAVLGICLIIFGYWLSMRMINSLLFFNMIAVMASTILGTYLIFRVTISWLFYRIRQSKQGHLGLHSSLSLAPLMHRMKGNANSLTIITVLSAMTLAMLAGAYSLFYSTEKETRLSLPFDYMFDEDMFTVELDNDVKASADKFTAELTELDIPYTSTEIEGLTVEGQFEEGATPEWMYSSFEGTVLKASALREAGLEIDMPEAGEAVFYDATSYFILKTMDLPFNVKLFNPDQQVDVAVTKLGEGNVVNKFFGGVQIVVDDAMYEELKTLFGADDRGSRLTYMQAINVVDRDRLEEASEIFRRINEESEQFRFDYYTQYNEAMENNGLLIFIAGFLGLVFLISTGSILYFKQMTEAEQEKKSYATLRQLGFTVKDIMRGIMRKQLFVFGVPLMIGLLHSIFAIKVASFLFISDITVPASIAMGIYALIYLVFAFLTVGYYRKTVDSAF
ncbi:ABC transporter permease [Sporosarcina oncorhynchi]|uniref:ABC transporter permease n=1 Tax=Sporosarcina oncorhynchi TaxID=3056444 RepID=A0ABZ0L6Z0_9BACL|nr:ABC transporter permease [Sporosarcina sp. T2O-4]WOV87828.1 ABC transporter permease [Sporosarcina sp. T2O-4]